MERPRSTYAGDKGVYPQTGRKVIKMPSVEGGMCKVDQDYLPVWREEGKYFTQQDQRYCGTFYYYEPDSQYFLNLGNSLVAGGKIDALRILEGRDDFKEAEGQLALSQARIAILSFVDQFFPGKLPKNWQKEVVAGLNGAEPNPEFEEALDKIFRTREGQRMLKELDKMSRILNLKELESTTVSVPHYTASGRKEILTIDPFYNLTTSKGKRYVGEAFMVPYRQLDQLICTLARDQGYDTVVLQREPAEKSVNTEIIDTRDRQESYRNICAESYNFDIITSPYPTIWLPDLGFLNYKIKP